MQEMMGGRILFPNGSTAMASQIMRYNERLWDGHLVCAGGILFGRQARFGVRRQFNSCQSKLPFDNLISPIPSKIERMLH